MQKHPSFSFSSLCCFASFLTPVTSEGTEKSGRKTVSAWEQETWVCYEVLAPLTPCAAGLEVALRLPQALQTATNQIRSARYKEPPGTRKVISFVTLYTTLTCGSASHLLPAFCIRSILVLPSLSSSCLSPSLSLCFFPSPFLVLPLRSHGDGWEESELVWVGTLQTGREGTGIFNTHRLYSMSAMFPRWCRAFLYAFSASAILPWFFSTFPKFPQATGDMCTSKVALSEWKNTTVISKINNR